MTIAWEGATLKISNSEIQTFKDCRRKWYLVYYRELALKRSEQSGVGARELGTRVHVALEALYAHDANPIEVLDAIYAADIAEIMQAGDMIDDDKIVELGKEQTLAKIMVEGFMEWREENGIDVGLEVVATEAVVEVNLPQVPGTMLRAKMDQRVHRKMDGARLFRDWKTVGNLTDPPKILPMDEQMKFYHLLEYLESIEKTGAGPQWRTDGALYTMLRKVKRTATAKPPFYDQIEVHHNMEELRSMWRRTVRVVQEIVVHRQELDAFLPEDPKAHQSTCPPRPSRDCGWKCDFFTVCAMMDDGSNVEGLLNEYYTHLDPHERYAAQDNGKEVTE